MRGTLSSRRSTSGWITCSLDGCVGVVGAVAWPNAGAASAASTKEVVRAEIFIVVVCFTRGSEEERQARGDRAVFAAARVAEEGGVDRVIEARDEALGDVKAQAHHRVGQLGVGGRGVHEAQVGEVPELAEADAEGGRQAPVGPRL